MIRDKDALEYHSRGRRGKIEVVPTKPCLSQRDLALAYTPGVAAPCLKIRDDPEAAALYTARGNLVAVITNGSAVLGLGDIGALAGKPVMEGKGVLFKRFADIDVFDLELDTHDPQEIIRTVELLAPTFGGINLEDIKAPECFEIESELIRRLSIPVFHDDQHGTAIISGAALLNALELAGKSIDDVRVVFSGAGASGIACANYYLALGVKPQNLILCDSRGVIHTGRADLNPYKQKLAAETQRRTLGEALVDADVFVGLSVADALDPAALRTMSADPIVFALANPTPEIGYDAARVARPDAIVATGRSDYPNQINNVLGFPFIFRGALDVLASAINMEMKLAATTALAALAREDVSDSVMQAYGLTRLHFGPDYLIPKPFDRRALLRVATAVARAAIDSGVAGQRLDIDRYTEALESRLGKSREVMRLTINQAKRHPKRLVLSDGEHPAVLRAAQVIRDEGFAEPVLIGDEVKVREAIADLELHLDEVEIVDPTRAECVEVYTDELYKLRARKGLTRHDAAGLIRDPTVFGSMMLQLGHADALVAGIEQHYPDALRPVLRIIGTEGKRAHSVHLMIVKDRVILFADTTVNIAPNSEELAEIAISTADVARRFHLEPRLALLSFSDFGSVRHEVVERVRRAVEIVKRERPELMVDGEMQLDTAMTPELIARLFPFSTLRAAANVLVFPDLQSANIGFKLLQQLGGAEAIGPILTGMRRPVHLVQHGCGVKDVVNLAAIAIVEAHERREQQDERATDNDAVADESRRA